MGLTAQLCQALEGFRFVYVGRMVLSLRPGLYENGRAALEIVGPDGPYAALTVNLPDEELGEDEMFVRTGNGSETDVHAVRALVATSRFWEMTGRSAASGYVDNYASVWRFRRCLDHADGAGDYRVLCDECRDAVKRRFETELETIQAADAVRRLTGRRKDEDDDA